jgi:hypothetical protein
MTFAIILETPVPDKSKVKEILLDRDYTLKHYDIGLMEAYDKDGKKIENKLASNPHAIEKYKGNMYQLKGKYCNVDFSRDNPIILYKFGEKLEHGQYNFAENLEEIKSVIKILDQFATYDASPCELLVSLNIKGKQNSDATLLNLKKTKTEEFIVKDTHQMIAGMKNHPSKFQERLKRSPPPSPAEHLEVHHSGTIDSRSTNTEAVIRARDEKYSLVLRFNATGTDNPLHDLTRCEEFGLNIIEKLESVSKLD